MGIIKKMESKPKKPLSGFFSFNALQRANHTGDDKLSAKELGSRWSELSEEEKEKYNAPAKKLQEQYSEDLKAWKEANTEVAEEEKSRGKSKGKKVKRAEEDEDVEEKPKKNKAKKGDHDEKKKSAKEEKKPKKVEKAADDGKKDAKKGKKSVK